MTKIESHIVGVNAEKAKGWLESNRRNRALRRRLVDTYARDMLAGDWVVTGEAIKFSRDGKLIDGQHRLEAILIANETRPDLEIPLMVIYGLDPDSQHVMDTGARRTVGDSLALDGIANASFVASTARLVAQYENGDITTNTVQMSTPEIRDWVDAHPSFPDFISRNLRHAQKSPAPSPSGLLAMLWKLTEIDSEMAQDFYTGFATQENLSKGDPRMTLFLRFVDIRIRREQARARDVMGLMILAWNAYRKGRTLSTLRRPGESWNSSNFPVPI